jgi:hypothetical protein
LLTFRFRLVLLSLYNILGKALTELKIIVEELLPPLKDDDLWSYHAHHFDQVLSMYRVFLATLRFKLKSFPNTIAQIVFLAMLNIGHAHQYLAVDEHVLKETDILTSGYKAKGHSGIVHILQMQRLQHCRHPSDLEVQELFENRQRLISVIDEVLERCGLQEDFQECFDCDIHETQLFIPRELFQIPAVVKAIKLDGKRDILRRSIGHMFYDNKVDMRLSLQTTDGADILGRTRLHMTCASGQSEPLYTNTLSTASTWLRPHMWELNALDIAAMHGNTQIFRSAVASGYDTTCLERSLRVRTYLHWAAAYGHLDLVEYLLEVFMVSKIDLAKVMTIKDIKDDTTLHLAARHGRPEVVEVLLRHVDWNEMERVRAPFSRSPFEDAVNGRHVQIVKILEPFSDVNGLGPGNGPDSSIPLTEAARQGFLDFVEYLLCFRETIFVNPVVKGLDVMTGAFGSKTPLDVAIEGEHHECAALLKAHGALRSNDIST